MNPTQKRSLTCECCFGKMYMTPKMYDQLSEVYEIVGCDACRLFDPRAQKRRKR